MGFASIRAAATASLVIAALVVSSDVAAQAVVRGVLYDDATGRPLQGTVMLIDPQTDAAVVHSATDSAGNFSLQTRTGTYQISAVRPGYKSIISKAIPLNNGERLTIRVPIAEAGDPQHQIGVLERVRPTEGDQALASDGRRVQMSGFEARRLSGLGRRYLRTQLERSGVATLGQFLQSVPGMSVMDPTSTSSMRMNRSAAMDQVGMTRCRVGWFLDGHRIDLPGQSDPMTDGLGSMGLDVIEAVEVFRGISEMPAEFAAPDLQCGAVAIWSRRI
jgi:hypothetical protein